MTEQTYVEQVLIPAIADALDSGDTAAAEVLGEELASLQES